MSELWNTLVAHWPTWPLMIPLVGAFATPFLGRNSANLRRASATLFLFATVAAGVFAVDRAAAADALYTYEVSSWSAPFGIVLVVDRLAATLVTMTSVLGLGGFLYAIFGDDELGEYFHALYLVQIAGLNGAFLTGDIFNLFVFFEILLIASYNLLVYGGGPKRTLAGIHYVVLNLIGSALFLMAVGLLYGLTGTLNMADMAVKLAELPAADAALARSAATLLTVVFAIKAALLPLYFWLPRAYGNATAPVAAIFAVMTKVGVYAILRTSTLLFGEGSGVVSGVTDGWLLPLALVTLLAGTLGVAAARRLQVLIAYLVIVSVGTILVPVALGTPEAIAAALYYLVHSTFIAGALFLICDLIADRRGEAADSLEEGPALDGSTGLALLFFTGALVVVGLPPTSGFLGKVMILESALGEAATGWIWATILASSLLVLVALAVAGSRLFWRTESGGLPEAIDRPGRIVAPLFLLAVIAGWTAFGGQAYDYLDRTARQILDTDTYVESVNPQSFDPSRDLGGDKH